MEMVMQGIREQIGGEMESHTSARTVAHESRFVTFRLHAEQRQLELLKQEWFGDPFLLECGECEAIVEPPFGHSNAISA
jgi:hypothetical protein